MVKLRQRIAPAVTSSTGRTPRRLPVTQPQYTPAFLERFWSKVDRNGPIPEYAPHLGPCWIWSASLSRGYGQICFQGRLHRVHRVSFSVEYGSTLLKGMDIDHLCRVTACVRPSHLEQVTHRVNVARGAVARRWQRSSTKGKPASNACRKGHDNWRTDFRNPNWRKCMTCKAAGSVAYRQRRRQRDQESV